MPEENKVVYEISILSVLKILILFVGIWLLFLVRDILILLLIVGIISIALEPFVIKLQEKRIPKAVSVIFIYLILLLVLGFIAYFIIPPVATQMRELATNLPYYSSRISEYNFSDYAPVSSFLNSISQRFSDIAGGFLEALVSIFGGIVYAIAVFALTFYALVDSDGIKKTLVSFIPIEKKERLLLTFNRVSGKLGDWLRGQLIIMLAIGVVDWIILSILGVQYALVLGLLAAVLEIVPVVGPLLSGFLALLIAFISGEPLWKLAAIAIAYLLVQQLENNILVPKVMQKAIGLSPIIIIIAVLVGSRLLGLGGAILAVPIAAGIQVFIEEYLPVKKKA